MSDKKKCNLHNLIGCGCDDSLLPAPRTRTQSDSPRSEVEEAREWMLKQPCDGRMIDHKGLYWIPVDGVPSLLAAYRKSLEK